MENASKALIIAGAILLSILIIGLGMAVYNSSQSSAANADLSAQEIASFNSSFEAYEGKQKGTAVRQLITAVKSSNEKNTDRVITIVAGSNKWTLGGKDVAAKAPLTPSDPASNVTYDVKFTYNNDKENGPIGIIKTITVTEAGKS